MNQKELSHGSGVSHMYRFAVLSILSGLMIRIRIQGVIEDSMILEQCLQILLSTLAE